MRTAQKRFGHVAVFGDEDVGVARIDRRQECIDVEAGVHDAAP
jgi:hypothetical protein